MKYFQETTEWNISYNVLNHIYYMNDAKTKAVGYIPHGEKDLVLFSKPLTIETKGRKFIALSKKAESDDLYFPKTETKHENVIQVSGSNGKIYSLKKTGSMWSCSCPGFQFRNKCKHVEEQKQK